MCMLEVVVMRILALEVANAIVKTKHKEIFEYRSLYF